MVHHNKKPQYENHNFSEMREYFCTKFCSFVQHITAQICCFMPYYTTYAKMTET